MLQRHYQLGCPFELYGKRLEHTAHNASFVGPTSFFEQLATPRARFIDATYPMQLRNDRNVPASILLSEFGLSDFGAAGGRTFHLQPDSSHIRVWELAGATHLETGWFQELTANASRSIPGFAVIFAITHQAIPASSTARRRARPWTASTTGPMMRRRHDPRRDSVWSCRMRLIPDTLVAFNRDPATNLLRLALMPDRFTEATQLAARML